MPQILLSSRVRISFFLSRLLFLCSGLVLLDQNLTQSLPAQAQIIPNGAGTMVNPQGSQINISGGTQAGANLFHSFRDFNVNFSQVANFLSNPQTQNILARINGGNPSLINGLLQVTGGNSHLFLMNPAGIVFGQGAMLNVPASLTATTANQIGFGNNLFHAFGDNNFSALTGNPDSFLFTTTQSGSIVNAGNLAVGNGQNISLIAGNTINTGRLTAPGGEIQVLAVPGTNRVKLSQPGQVLSLEIVPPIDGTLRAVDLPALLTGNDLPGIVVNPNGQVQVAGTSLPSQQGIAVASGAIDVSSTTGNGGVVQVMGDRVAALNSRINANGAIGGGTVRLGGEYLGGRDTGIAPEFRFNSQRTLVDRNSLIRANATVTGEGGRVIVWADQNTGYFGRITGRGATGRGGFVEISGRENLAFDGRVEIPGANGLLGTLLLDPTNITIVPGANNSQADDAQVNVDGTILSGDLPTNMTISAGALAAIPGGTTINITATNNIDVQSDFFFTPLGTGSVTFTAPTITSSGTFNLVSGYGRNLTIVADSINAPNLTLTVGNSSPTSNISVTANTGDLRIGTVSTFKNGVTTSGTISLNAPQGNIIADVIDSSSPLVDSGGDVNLNAPNGSITVTSINTNGRFVGRTGGAVNINAGNLVRITGTNVCGSSICTTGNNGASNGAVTIRHGGGTTTPFIVGNSAINGTAGIIDAGPGSVINPTTTIPVPPLTFTQGIVQIITALPVVPTPPQSTLSPDLFLLLRNPPAPPTPAPVVAGAPSVPEPIAVAVVEPPTPPPVIPSVIPIVIPEPIVSPPVVTNPVPIPIAIAPPVIPGLNLTPELITALNRGGDEIVPESPSGTLTLITNPTSVEVSMRLIRGLGDRLPFSDSPASYNLAEIQNNLSQTSRTNGIKPALIYFFFAPDRSGIPEKDSLEVILITEKGEPLRVQFLDVTRRQVLAVLNRLQDSSIYLPTPTNPENGVNDNSSDFFIINGMGESRRLQFTSANRLNTRLSVSSGVDDPRFDRNAARQLYQWLVAPLEQELQAQGIDNLVFIGSAELQGLSLRGLYDGQRFVRERYTIR